MMTVELPELDPGEYTAGWQTVTPDDNGVEHGTSRSLWPRPRLRPRRLTPTPEANGDRSAAPTLHPLPSPTPTAAPTPAPTPTGGGDADGQRQRHPPGPRLAAVVLLGLGIYVFTRATLTRLADLPDPGAVVFDLDGTLVDTVETRIRAWMQVFEEVGLPG